MAPTHGELTALADDFWSWQALTQPTSSDDIPRIERPVAWSPPNWSAETLAVQRQHRQALQVRWEALGGSPPEWPIHAQVDYQLIGSALARVRWEIDVTRAWQRNPYLYVQQTLGPLFELLLPPPPFDVERSESLVQRAATIPATIELARVNLSQQATAVRCSGDQRPPGRARSTPDADP